MLNFLLLAFSMDHSETLLISPFELELEFVLDQTQCGADAGKEGVW